MIRVLVADDSPTARALLVELLGRDAEIQVVGEATNGEEAVRLARTLRPDVLSMDIRMPHVDGFEATRRIMADTPIPIVIVSGLDLGEIKVSLDALRAGALAVLPKPAGPSSSGFEEDARQLVATVKAMSQVKLLRRPGRPAPAAASVAAARPVETAPRPLVRTELVALAASTGGPAALRHILSELPHGFPAPLVVVQHIAHGFAAGFAAWLGEESALRIKLAEDGEPLVAGTAYLAPDDAHLGVTRDRVVVQAAPPIDGFRPSANYLFESVARSHGEAALGVVLTGMGSDGVEGLRALRASGGRIIAQDEASSEIFGMPAAAIEAGLPDLVCGLAEIPSNLSRAVRM